MDLVGTIIEIYGRRCTIYTDEKKIYHAITKKRVKGSDPNQIRPVAVGDKVKFEKREDKKEGLIYEVLPRKSWLTRKAVGKAGKQQVIVANVDQLMIVTSIKAPPFHSGIIDRFLIAAQKGKLTPIIIVNKIDLKDEEENWNEIERRLKVYNKLGYETIFTSIKDLQTIEKLREKLKDKSSVFAGHSGVGKSSLLSLIDPNLKGKIVTKEVSQKTLKGKHATTTVRLYPLYFGGFVVDTPGIRELSLWELKKEEVSLYFPEMKERRDLCKYKDCTHTHEPEEECAIKQAVKKGEIEEFRYKSYCNILESLEEE